MSVHWDGPVTPTTSRGLRVYDDRTAADAARLAWIGSGRRSDWHALCVGVVRRAMPVLARALDRLTYDPPR